MPVGCGNLSEDPLSALLRHTDKCDIHRRTCSPGFSYLEDKNVSKGSCELVFSRRLKAT